VSDDRLSMESSAFYLHVSRRALTDLEAIQAEPIWPGGWRREGELLWDEIPSDHFRHAVVCTVFAAAAVEHALVALAQIRKLRGKGPRRDQVLAVWPRGRLTGVALVGIARALSKVDGDLLTRVEGLFDRRNCIVHSQAEGGGGPVAGLPGWWEKSVDLPGITSEVISDASGDLQIAEEAVEALKVARGEPEWNPFRE